MPAYALRHRPCSSFRACGLKAELAGATQAASLRSDLQAASVELSYAFRCSCEGTMQSELGAVCRVVFHAPCQT
jgi:hypothetical protein